MTRGRKEPPSTNLVRPPPLEMSNVLNLNPVKDRQEKFSCKLIFNSIFICLSVFSVFLRCCNLTPWSRVLLGQLTVTHVINKFPAFYGRFITVFATARHWSLS
jgi:hypothetical protein